MNRRRRGRSSTLVVVEAIDAKSRARMRPTTSTPGACPSGYRALAREYLLRCSAGIRPADGDGPVVAVALTQDIARTGSAVATMVKYCLVTSPPNTRSTTSPTWWNSSARRSGSMRA